MIIEKINSTTIRNWISKIKLKKLLLRELFAEVVEFEISNQKTDTFLGKYRKLGSTSGHLFRPCM